MKVQYVFVHGLSGWGSYDAQYEKTPYWGMRCGDAVKWLNSLGYECYAASVAPKGSAWDRACELYAQLTGTVTDYGKAHSEKAGHERFGRDFSSQPLIPVWDSGHPAVLIGHSFGGATVRLFSELLYNGDEEERNATGADELSPFFKGGKDRPLKALVTLAAPHNGTTAYDLFEDPSFDVRSVKVPLSSHLFSQLMTLNNRTESDGRESFDYAAYDMHIDNADALNRRISTFEDVWYFSWPASCTERQADGTQYPRIERTEPFFVRTSIRMGAYTGTTKGGMRIGADWQENDGLVNTLSAKAPSHAPSVQYDPENIRPGVWNIMPVYPYDHMSFQGGMMHSHDIFPFYRQMMKLLSSL